MAPKYNLNHVSTTHPFMTCIVKVDTQYSSYSRKTVAKVLEKCHGVHSFRMDDNGVVEISGTVNPSLLLKMLGRAGRSAELCWFQFGECSSNLFVATNDVGYGGGSTCSRDGRYLHASNLSRPTVLPSQTNYGYDHNHHYSSHHDFQFPYYDHSHDYHHRHQQHCDHTHNRPYQSGYGQGRNHAQYRSSSLQSRGGEDIGCCSVM